MRHLSCLLLLLCCAGCQTPLAKYIKENKYTPFQPARAGDGVLTIVDYENGYENIVAGAAECFKGTETTNINIFLPKYDLKADNNLELNLAGVFDTGIKLAGAFKDHRVKSVSIEFIEPFYERASDLAVEKRLAELAQNGGANQCAVKLSQKPNFLIKQVMGAKGLRYTFNSSRDQTIVIDGQLLDYVNMSATNRTHFEKQNSMTINQSFFAGYRLWKPQPKRAFDKLSFELQTLQPADVEALKNAARKSN